MKKVKFLIVFIVFSSFMFAESMGFSAGYDDGCLSAKGNFTKSTFAYDNIPEYKKGWILGNKECKAISASSNQTVKPKKRYKHYSKRRKKHKRYSRCKSNPWITFSRGWDDGYRSARGRWKKLSNRCAEYYRGWYEGYNHCKCQELGECVAVSSLY